MLMLEKVQLPVEERCWRERWSGVLAVWQALLEMYQVEMARGGSTGLMMEEMEKVNERCALVEERVLSLVETFRLGKVEVEEMKEDVLVLGRRMREHLETRRTRLCEECLGEDKEEMEGPEKPEHLREGYNRLRDGSPGAAERWRAASWFELFEWRARVVAYVERLEVQGEMLKRHVELLEKRDEC